MKNILRQLRYFSPSEKEGYIELIIPVVIKIYKACLRLRIYKTETGYVISDEGDTFYDCNEDSEYYYDLFSKNDKNNHYEIKLKDDYFYKEYPSNFNINVALSEFIKFYVYLDDYIKNNDIR